MERAIRCSKQKKRSERRLDSEGKDEDGSRFTCRSCFNRDGSHSLDCYIHFMYIYRYTKAHLHGALEVRRLSTILATVTSIPVITNVLNALSSLVRTLRPHI